MALAVRVRVSFGQLLVWNVLIRGAKVFHSPQSHRFLRPMSGQRDTKTRRRPPHIPATGNDSQRIGGPYPDTTRMVICSDTTQQLRIESEYRSHREPGWC